MEFSQGNVNGHSENQNSDQEFHDRNYEGKVAGLEPINFIASATPHLGSRGHKQVITLYLSEKLWPVLLVSSALYCKLSNFNALISGYY